MNYYKRLDENGNIKYLDKVERVYKTSSTVIQITKEEYNERVAEQEAKAEAENQEESVNE